MNPRFFVGALDEATFTMSLTENASYPLANLATYLASDLWVSSANTNGQTLKIDFGAARPRNFCIIEGHNFSGMTTVVLQSADDSAYSTNLTTVVSSLIGSNASPLKFEFNTINQRYWRILFTDTNTTTPQLGQIFIDQKVEFVSQDFGYRPRNEDYEATYRRTSLSGIERATQVYAGRLRYEMQWQNVNNRFLEDLRWLHQKARGDLAPFYFYDETDRVFYLRFAGGYNPASVNAYRINNSVTIPFVSQGIAQNAYTQQTNPMAITLDGSTEYASKSSPVNLDMNGSELLSNPTFDANVTNWGVTGSNTLTHETGVKRTGAGSAKIQRTASGDMRFGPYSEGKTTLKATFEAWVYLPSANTGSRQVQILILSFGYTTITSADAVTLTDDTWTKLVFNFELTAAQMGTGYWPTVSMVSANANDILYIDDCSLTPAYDFTVSTWFKTTTDGAGIIEYSDAAKYPYRFDLGGAVAGKIRSLTYDGTNVISVQSLNSLLDGAWHLLTASFDRDGNLTLYVDSVSQGTASMVFSIGKLSTSSPSLWIGRMVLFGAYVFAGQIGEVQIVRGYAMTAAQIANIYNTTGILRAYDATNFPNAVVVAHNKWRGSSDATFLRDETGYNNLTGTSVTQQGNQAIATYRIEDI